ncbi:unnamed protein product [Prunus brigantina]
MIMPHEFRGRLNHVVQGLRLRLTNGPLRPARNAARLTLCIFCPTSLRVIRTVGARIADKVDQMSPESSEDYRSRPNYRGNSVEFLAEVNLVIKWIF